MDEVGRGGGGRMKKRMRWQTIVWFLLRANREQDKGALTRTKGGTGGGGGERERWCVRRGVITWYWV